MLRPALAFASLLVLGGCPGPANDDDSVDNDDAANDDDSATPWDASPPDVPDGTVLEATVTCAAFLAPTDKAWSKQGADWQELPGHSAELQPELAPCVVDGPRLLTWNDLPRIRFEAGGWEHVLEPGASEDRWVGGAQPMAPSAECLEALQGLGWELPLTMAMDVTDLVAP